MYLPEQHRVDALLGYAGLIYGVATTDVERR